MAKILLGISNGLLRDNNYYPSGFMEQIITELKNCGNEILVYVPNRFQKRMFGGNNELLDGVDIDKLEKEIKDFNPDLVITFNNTIYNKVVDLVNCPIVVWGADAELMWNSKDIIKQNLDRYYFFCFSEQEMKPRQDYFMIKDDRIFLMKPATNIRNTHAIQDKNICFIGTLFSTNGHFLSLLDNWRGTKYIDRIIKNFQNFFIKHNDLLDGVMDEKLINDFLRLPATEYITFFSGEKRTQTLLALADMGLHIWGEKSWEKIRPILPSLYACVHKESVTSVAENEWVYNTSKICVNINHDQSVNGMNFRICDALASGGALISSFSPFVRQQFSTINIPMFNSPYEARDICQKYLKDEALRSDLVAKSNEVINNNWRWKNRFKDMSDILNVNLGNETSEVKNSLNSIGSIRYLEPKGVNDD